LKHYRLFGCMDFALARNTMLGVRTVIVGEARAAGRNVADVGLVAGDRGTRG
jgi:hypothetical protein